LYYKKKSIYQSDFITLLLLNWCSFKDVFCNDIEETLNYNCIH